MSKILSGYTEADEPEKKKEHKVLHYFQKHRAVVVAAAVLIVIMLGGSWQMAVNAEKHGGFFWWMDKNEEGTTMITSPETIDNSDNYAVLSYKKIEDIPEQYVKYAQIPVTNTLLKGYHLDSIKIVVTDDAHTIYEYFVDDSNDLIYFEIKIYEQEILRVRETYPGYEFCEEFENDGINLEVFKRNEDNGKQRYVIYFYYGNEKYAVIGMVGNEKLKEIAIEYQKAVVDNY